jgi:hypothetical protein
MFSCSALTASTIFTLSVSRLSAAELQHLSAAIPTVLNIKLPAASIDINIILFMGLSSICGGYFDKQPYGCVNTEFKVNNPQRWTGLWISGVL